MLQTLKQHRFLLEELVKRDFDRKYKGSLLGTAWSVLNPLLTLLIMRLVFGHFFGGGIPHYTTYLFCGTVVFGFFSESTSEGLMALTGNAHIFTKVNVPKYLFLLAKNAQTLINFALTLCVFFLFCALDGVTFSWRFLALLYPITMLLLFNMGMGFILSALYVFYRDIQYFWGILTQFIMYLSAVFYSIDSFSPQIPDDKILRMLRYDAHCLIDFQDTPDAGSRIDFQVDVQHFALPTVKTQPSQTF